MFIHINVNAITELLPSSVSCWGTNREVHVREKTVCVTFLCFEERLFMQADKVVKLKQTGNKSRVELTAEEAIAV